MTSWLRFSIRDMIWLTIIVAILCGWWLNNSHMRQVLWLSGREREMAQNEALFERQRALRLDQDLRRALNVIQKFGGAVE